jgi:type IV pilus assembly protein PilE
MQSAQGIHMNHRQHGVNLIELMIVIVVVSILAAIAIPSYRQYIIRTHRTHAKVALTQTALNLERCYTNSTPYAYDSATCNATVILPFTTPDGGHYVISYAGGAAAAQSFSLIATPQGGQVNDTACANFTLTSANVRGVSGSYSATPDRCWQK